MVPQAPVTTIGLVAVGASLGGTRALQALFAALPADFGAAIVVVLHRDKESDRSLIQFLQRSCRLPVEEAQDKAPIVPGHVYVAPSNYHLLVEGDHFALSTEAPVAYARPSIDMLFESTADACGSEAAGVILTGAGRDGAAGLAAIKRRGGLAIVQAPETAERNDMPRAALAVGEVDDVLPLESIASLLATRCGTTI